MKSAEKNHNSEWSVFGIGFCIAGLSFLGGLFCETDNCKDLFIYLGLVGILCSFCAIAWLFAKKE
jgi:hypothetical protein